MRIVAFSDTHEKHENIDIPDGDILVFAGDMSGSGGIDSIKEFNTWIGSFKHKHKIIIAGNHDRCLENLNYNLAKLQITNATYLLDSSIKIDKIKFYGSPYQPQFFNWAFNLPRGEALSKKWSKIPKDSNVLITHGPAYGILDQVPYNNNNVGCKDLLFKIKNLKKLKLHIFGHIHHSYGMIEQNGIKFVNASICDERYHTTNKPIIIDI